MHAGDNKTEATQGMVGRRWQEFAIQDQTNIKVVLRDYLHDHFDVEYDYVNHDRPGKYALKNLAHRIVHRHACATLSVVPADFPSCTRRFFLLIRVFYVLHEYHQC